MRDKQKILIVDDETPFRMALRRLLEKDHLVVEADTAAAALKMAGAQEPDLILLDIGLPDGSGLDVLPRLKELRPSPTVVMITAYEHVRDVVLAMKRGAFDYLVKPVDLDEFEVTIQHALEHAGLKNEVDRLRLEVQRLQRVDRLIGKNPAFLEAQMLAVKSAQSADAGVLLQGESGVGKELFAKLIHTQSPRAAYPFVALNCAAFSAEIIESELFGYEKGAFTGARAEGKGGLLESAQGGTLFLDEVADLHLEIQAKLLRALEEKEFFPLGSTRKRRVDIRVIAACNLDLWAATENGRFRKDLFFRLATIRIELPPLRRRQDDIIPLVRHFLDQFNDKYSKQFRSISPEASRILTSYPWPGNVRELRNTIERIVLLENEDTILGRHLQFLHPGQGDVLQPGQAEVQQSDQATAVHHPGQWLLDLPEEGLPLEEIEQQIILKAYEKCGRNKSRTARFLSIPRHVLLYRLKKMGFDG